MKRNNAKRMLAILATAFFLSIAACDHDTRGKKEGKHRETGHFQYRRDWNRCPAIVERTIRGQFIAVGDVHGGYERLVNLLTMAGLIKPDAKSLAGYSWAGGNRLLISVGDLIDKGNHSTEVLDLMMTLESQAPTDGGDVIVTLGNHEAEFLANPENKKAREFVAELHSKGIDPDQLPQGEKPYGEWLMNRPLAARVNDWFFANAGNTSGKTVNELSEKFRHEVNQGDWDSNFLIGDDSLLEAQKWWRQNSQPRALLDNYLVVLNVRHIVFGHDPGAFHNKGEIGQEEDGRIFLIDVGMSPAIDYSSGALLVIDSDEREVTATALDANGVKRQLWRAATTRVSK
jgi:hypothetical protein